MASHRRLNRLRPASGPRPRRLCFEPLEDRRVLSVVGPQVELFGVSPALFVENQGQWGDEQVRFLHQGSGANVGMTDSGMLFQVFRREELGGGQSEQPDEFFANIPDGRFDPENLVTHTLQFSAGFVGANTVAPTVDSHLRWGIHQISGVWVANSIGNLATYDQIAVGGQVHSALTQARSIPAVEGEDYWIDPLQTNQLGYSALISTENQWATGMVVTELPRDMDLEGRLQMSSQYGGWGFDRSAHIATPAGAELAGGETYQFSAIFRADTDLSLAGFDELSDQRTLANVALTSRGVLGAIPLATADGVPPIAARAAGQAARADRARTALFGRSAMVGRRPSRPGVQFFSADPPATGR